MTVSQSSGTYFALLQELFTINRTGRVRLGIHTTQQLLRAAGEAYQPNGYNMIHVAGTNGKGSVSTKLAGVCQAHGMRVGLYTSPHIASFRERIVVDNARINEQEVTELLTPLLEIAKKEQIPATFFELTTALAFGHFKRKQVDVAILEVGLGGRLDSTNVIVPNVSVITSIGLDHTELLGDTIEKIASEKGGIIKPHIPVVIGPNVPRDVIRNICKDVNAPLHMIDEHFQNYDLENNAIAKLAARLYFNSIGKGVDETALANGLKRRPLCRFQRLLYDPKTSDSSPISDSTVVSKAVEGEGCVHVVLDVGHNPPAFDRLFEMARQYYPKHRIRMVVGFSKEKDVVTCLQTLVKNATYLHFVKANSPRAADPQELLATIAEEHIQSDGCAIEILEVGNVGRSVKRAIQLASEWNMQNDQKELVVICGTFFIMGDAMEALKLDHPVDPFDLNESFSTSKPTDKVVV